MKTGLIIITKDSDFIIIVVEAGSVPSPSQRRLLHSSQVPPTPRITLIHPHFFPSDTDIAMLHVCIETLHSACRDVACRVSTTCLGISALTRSRGDAACHVSTGRMGRDDATCCPFAPTCRPFVSPSRIIASHADCRNVACRVSLTACRVSTPRPRISALTRGRGDAACHVSTNRMRRDDAASRPFASTFRVSASRFHISMFPRRVFLPSPCMFSSRPDLHPLLSETEHHQTSHTTS